MHKFVLYLCAVLLGACADQTSGPTAAPAPKLQSQWQTVSANLFFDDAGMSDVKTFADELNRMLNAQDSQNANTTQSAENAKPLSAPAVVESGEISLPVMVSKINMSNKVAEQQRFIQRIKLFLTHQYTSFNCVILSEEIASIVKRSPDLNDYVQSLQSLIFQYPVLTEGELEIYEADNEQGLFAYSRSSGSIRVYIAYNLSFDVAQMPLPLGFMSSTKVTVWQSDDSRLESFVTNSPIMVRPFTAVVVIVGS